MKIASLKKRAKKIDFFGQKGTNPPKPSWPKTIQKSKKMV